MTAAAPASGSSLSVATLAPVLRAADGQSSTTLPLTSVTAASGGAKYNSQRPYAIMNRRASNNASTIEKGSQKKPHKFRFKHDKSKGEFSIDSRQARISQDSGRNPNQGNYFGYDRARDSAEGGTLRHSQKSFLNSARAEESGSKELKLRDTSGGPGHGAHGSDDGYADLSLRVRRSQFSIEPERKSARNQENIRTQKQQGLRKAYDS